MSPKKILLVDDNPVFLKGMSMKLQKAGFEVLTAQHVSVATGDLREAKPDLILLDINFPPDMADAAGVFRDVFSTVEWLRRMGGASGIPVLLITGADSTQYTERARQAGAAGLLQKSCGTPELMRTINQLLN